MDMLHVELFHVLITESLVSFQSYNEDTDLLLKMIGLSIVGPHPVNELEHCRHYI